MRPNNHARTYDACASRVSAIRNRHLRILIVDDKPRWRRSMRFRLTSLYEAEVKDVGSGEEAVRTLSAGESFDIIFLDLSMPDMSGTQTYGELKSLDAGCPIVMMSAYSDDEEWAKAGQLHVELLSKPIPDDELEQILLKVPNR
jgi:CheY-like chemotaxis protein